MSKSSTISIRDHFRYRSSHNFTDTHVDGLRTWVSFCHDGRSENRLLLEKGINVPASVAAVDGARLPCVLIHSNPYKAGSLDTPWRDTFDVDVGHVRYFGDNKKAGHAPEKVPGNATLLRLFDQYESSNCDIRAAAAPLVFIRNLKKGGVTKGFKEFMGFGLIRSVERVSEHNRATNETYTNYVFDCVVFSMQAENETLNWDWINARRNPKLTSEEALRFSTSVLAQVGRRRLGIVRLGAQEGLLLVDSEGRAAKTGRRLQLGIGTTNDLSVL